MIMNLNYLRNKSILITGGSGSFGENFIKFLLKKSKNIGKIAVYSRDELKQSQLQLKFKKNKNLRFVIGDIRDKQRPIYALEGIDYVILPGKNKLQVQRKKYQRFIKHKEYCLI